MPMALADLLIRSGFVITMDPERRVFPQGTVAVRDERIVAIGPSDLMDEQWQAPTVIDASSKVVLPGLVDTHGHAGMALTKTVGFHLSGADWRRMNDDIFFHATDADFWYADGLLSSLERLKFGTTTGMALLGGAPRADRPEPAEAFLSGVLEVGLRSAIAVGPARPPWPKKFSWWEGGQRTEYEVTLEQTLDVVVSLAKRHHRSYGNRVQIWVGASRFSVPSMYDPMYDPQQLPYAHEQIRLMDAVAREHGLGIHTHAYGGVIEYLNEHFQVLGPHVCLAHCQGLSEHEVQVLADTGTSIAYCPSARRNYTFPGRCPVPEAQARGVTVAIATDGPGPDRTLDLFKDMRNAIMIQRIALTDPRVIPEGQALAMVTIEAARALGLDDEIGSLEVGKRADLITIDLQAPHLFPRFMEPYRVVCEAAGHDVADVVVNGRVLMRDRQLTTVDERKVLHLAQAQAELALERSGLRGLTDLSPRFWGERGGCE